MLGVVQGGTFRFYVNIEALGAEQPPPQRPGRKVSARSCAIEDEGRVSINARAAFPIGARGLFAFARVRGYDVRRIP